MKVAHFIFSFCLAISLFFQAAYAIADAHYDDTNLRFDEAVEAVHDKDFRKALSIFKSLANDDISDAQFNAALLIKAGMGQPRNFSEAYFWAVLSDLGGELRASSLVSQLSKVLPEEEIEMNYSRIIDRLTGQLSNGDRSAIIKYARIQSEFLTIPDYEVSYIWYSIAQALGIKGGFEGSNEIANYLEAADLIIAQNKSIEIFEGSAFSSVAD